LLLFLFIGIDSTSGSESEEESEITANELPAKVREAHARSAQAKWTLNKVERVTITSPSSTRFELQVSDGKQHMEIAYGADGKLFSATRHKAGEDQKGEQENERDD